MHHSPSLVLPSSDEKLLVESMAEDPFFCTWTFKSKSSAEGHELHSMVDFFLNKVMKRASCRWRLAQPWQSRFSEKASILDEAFAIIILQDYIPKWSKKSQLDQKRGKSKGDRWSAAQKAHFTHICHKVKAERESANGPLWEKSVLQQARDSVKERESTRKEATIGKAKMETTIFFQRI